MGCNQDCNPFFFISPTHRASKASGDRAQYKNLACSALILETKFPYQIDLPML